MNNLNIFAFAMGLATLISCTHLKTPEIPEYKISKTGPWIISESPYLWSFFERSVIEDELTEFDLIFRNTGTKEYKVRLGEAYIRMNQEKAPIQCKNKGNSSKEMLLKPNDMGRILCEIKITPNSQNQLRQRDTIVQVYVPTDGEPIVTERLFRIESFE